MWIKLKTYLRKPFPITRKAWRISIIAALIVFFLLFLFQSIPNTSFATRFIIILGFALVAGIVTLLLQIVPQLILKDFYSEDNWTIGKQLLQTMIILLFIGIGNFLYGWFISGHCSISLFLSYVISTFLVGIIPAVIITIYTQNTILKRNLQEASILNKQLLSLQDTLKSDLKTDTQIISFGVTTKGSVELDINEILYIESIKNYCSIFYISDNKVNTKKIRSTLSQIEENLLPYPFIIRCHRAFMVNTHFIIEVEGNSQGYLLKLNVAKNLIPVSRSYTKGFSERFTD